MLALVNRLQLIWRLLLTQTVYRGVFGSTGSKTIVFPFGLLLGAKHIFVGRRSLIRYGARLEIVQHGQDWVPRLTIGDNVNIEQNVHIICHDTITIEDHVSIAGNCAIVDTSHRPKCTVIDGESDLDVRRSATVIGHHSFLGYGTVVLSNVTIGAYCVIGANSVVTCNIPDFAVAAGAPARVLRFLGPTAA